MGAGCPAEAYECSFWRRPWWAQPDAGRNAVGAADHFALIHGLALRLDREERGCDRASAGRPQAPFRLEKPGGRPCGGVCGPVAGLERHPPMRCAPRLA